MRKVALKWFSLGLIGVLLLVACGEDEGDDNSRAGDRTTAGTFSLELPDGWKTTTTDSEGSQFTIASTLELSAPPAVSNVQDAAAEIPGLTRTFRSAPILIAAPVPNFGFEETAFELVAQLVESYEEEGMRVVERARQESITVNGVEGAEISGEIEVVVDGEVGRYWAHAAVFLGDYEILVVAGSVPISEANRYRDDFEDVVRSVREEGLDDLPTRLADFERRTVGDASLEVPAGWVVSQNTQDGPTLDWAIIAPRPVNVEDTFFDIYYWTLEDDLRREMRYYVRDIPLLEAYFSTTPVMALLSTSTEAFGFGETPQPAALLRMYIRAANGGATPAEDTIQEVTIEGASGARYTDTIEVRLNSGDRATFGVEVVLLIKEGRVIVFGGSYPTDKSDAAAGLARMVESLRFE